MKSRFLFRIVPLSILLIFLSINTVLSQTKDWIGGIGNWDVGTNWSPTGVPTATDRVTITGLSDVTIPTTFNAVAQDIYMSTGADLTVAATGTLSVNGSTQDGINLQGNGTTLTNLGTIRVGNTSAVYRNGIALFEQSQIINTISGIIEIDRITFNIGLALSSPQILPPAPPMISVCINNGSIRIGQNAAVNAAGIFVERSTFTNGTTGSIEIANITTVGKGVVVYGENAPTTISFNNSGTISATSTGIEVNTSANFQNNLNATIGISGITVNNKSTFTNLSTITTLGGVSVINRSQFINGSDATLISGPIYLFENGPNIGNETLNASNMARMTNSGIIRITANVYYGIQVHTALLTNNATGNIEINNVTQFNNSTLHGAIEISGYVGFTGYSAVIGSVVNAGSIRIGNLGTIREDGIVLDLFANFENQATGSVEINNITDKNAIEMGNRNFVGGESSFTNSGSIRIGNLSPIQKKGIYTYVGAFTNNIGGTIEIDNINLSTGNAFYAERTPIINNGTLKLGTHSNRYNGLVLNTARFTNGTNAVLEIDRVNGIGIDFTYPNSSLGASIPFNNSGIIRIGQTIGVISGIYQSGLTNFTNQSTGTIEINNVVQQNFAGGTAISLNGYFDYTTTFTNSGTLKIGNTGNITTGINISGINALFTNNGGANVEIDRITDQASQSGIALSSRGSFFNAGNLRLGTNTTDYLRIYATTQGSTLTNTGVITLGNTANSFQPITNNGTIQVNGGRTFYNVGIITNNVNSTFKGSGTASGGGLIFNTGSSIAPGLSPGRLTIGSDLDLGSSTYICEINGTTASTTYDVLAITEAATLTNATLQVVWGFTPAAGNTFTILTCGSRTGQFSAINIPAIAGRNFTVQYFTTSVVIEVTAVLPAELVHFSAKQQGEKAELNWKTTTETTIKNFDIEKSLDGKTFSKIAEVKANNTPSVYSAVDDQFSASAYYRLKINDLDGKSKFSNIVFLEKSPFGGMRAKIQRNTEGVVWIETDDKIESVTVTNSIGQVVKTTKDNRLSLADLPKGVYIISVKTDKAYVSEKVFNF